MDLVGPMIDQSEGEDKEVGYCLLFVKNKILHQLIYENTLPILPIPYSFINFYVYIVGVGILEFMNIRYVEPKQQVGMFCCSAIKQTVTSYKNE